jgi:hypothetical protein
MEKLNIVIFMHYFRHCNHYMLVSILPNKLLSRPYDNPFKASNQAHALRRALYSFASREEEGRCGSGGGGGFCFGERIETSQLP